MILYFSATGNDEYVAKRLAKAVGDQTASIVDLMNKDQYDIEDEAIGIVTPTYFWGLPVITQEFLEKVTLKSDYVYLIATYGTTPGFIGQDARKAFHHSIDAFYSVRMADTWTPQFDLSTPEKVAKFTKTTEEEIEYVIDHVRYHVTGNFMNRKISAIVKPISKAAYENARKTKHFHVEETCIGCGLCARKCPVHAIEMEEKRPVWVKDKCVMCLGCLHRCPKFAIQYGKKTKNHGQYQNPDLKNLKNIHE